MAVEIKADKSIFKSEFWADEFTSSFSKVFKIFIK